MGKVYLIGAGPGDPKLITVKGLEILKKADVVVYDRLANPRLMSEIRPEAERIYVGKLPDRHTLKQEEINRLLVEKGSQKEIVVRLKGGDPFVFGRGGEEADALASAGIEFEVVPGISSSVAAPAYAGIPVTHRGLASSFAVITGHEDPAKTESSINWEHLSRGVDTLVFLMGMENLGFITRRLLENGRPPETPVGLVMWGTTRRQRTLVTDLASAPADAEREGFASPSVIIVGKVVRLKETLSWFEKKPLLGRRILVTRSREQASRLSERIEDLGGEALEYPVIRIAPPEDSGPLERAVESLAHYDWLVLTSVNGVDAVFRALRRKGLDLRALAPVKVAAIGPATAGALSDRGLVPDYVPGEYRAEAIIEGLKGRVGPGTKVLLARADIARKALSDGLKALGAEVDDVVAYRTLLDSGDRSEVRRLLEKGAIDYVTFTSSSTVRNFLKSVGPDAVGMLRGVRIASIGPITSDTARQAGLEVAVEAEEYTIEGLVAGILKDLSNAK